MNHYSSEGSILVVLAAVFGSLVAVNHMHSGAPAHNVPVGYDQKDIEAVTAIVENSDTDRLIAAIQHVESHGDPDAVSKKGARGAYQTMAATEKRPGFGVQPMSRFSRKEQARFARDYAQAMLNHYDRMLAEAAYNAGPGAVDRAMKKALSGLPKETRNYVKKVEKQLASNEE